MGLRPVRREQLLEQLATMLESGLPLAGAWQRAVASGGGSDAMRAVGTRLAKGWSLEDALTRAIRDGQAPFAAWEVAWLAAGERSGTLPASCARLAGHWTAHRETVARLRSGLAYPATLLLLLLFVAPVDCLITGGIASYAAALASLVARTLGLLLLAGLAAGLAGRSPRIRTMILLVLERLPILGTPWRLAAEIRLTRAMAALWRAGVSLDETWPIATMASGAPGLEAIGTKAAEAIRGGHEPLEALERVAVRFGRDWVAAYATGESTGKLDETLERHAKRRDGDFDRALALLVRTISQAGYVLVAAMLVQKIAGMYAGAMQQVEGALRDIY